MVADLKRRPVFKGHAAFAILTHLDDIFLDVFKR